MMASDEQHTPDISDGEQDGLIGPVFPLHYEDDTTTMQRVLAGLKDTA